MPDAIKKISQRCINDTKYDRKLSSFNNFENFVKNKERGQGVKKYLGFFTVAQFSQLQKE